MRYCAGSCGLLMTAGWAAAAAVSVAAAVATAAAGNANNAEAALAAQVAARRDGGGDGDVDGDGDRDDGDGDDGDDGGAANIGRGDSLLNLFTLTFRVEHMKLHGSYTSPFVRHCRVACAQQGIGFDFIEVDHAASAAQSPVAKMPYLTGVDGGMLTDSSSILKYIREQGGGKFLDDLDDFETFALANTVQDSMINVFLLETEGFGAEQIRYIGRQNNRIAGGLEALNRRLAGAGIAQDGALRCACMLDWALFRGRIAGLDEHPNLRDLLATANQDPQFADTAPPPAPPPSAS